MKFNFKKISAIGASLLMTGLSVGVAAAAAYPAPFVDQGIADVAIVYGTGAGVSALDLVQAGNIQNSLGSSVTGTTAVIGGDSFKLEKTSNYFNFNEDLNDVYPNLDKDQMENFLADGTYDDGTIDEEYEQKIIMGNLALNPLMLFSDSDYEDSEPTVGFHFADDDLILTYELEYDNSINFTAMEDTNLPILGGEYYVLSTTGSTTLELLDSAEKNILAKEETVTVGDKVVAIEFIDDDEVKFNVNGEITDKLIDHGYEELSDGSYIVANEILYDAKENGVSKVEFSIGAGLMKLVSGSEIEINDEKVDGVYATFTGSADLTKIAIEWKSHKDTFLTEANSLTMPGFEGISLAFGGLDDDATAEEIVFSSGDTLELQMDNFDIPLMNSESADVYLGEDGNRLITKISTGLNYTNFSASDTGYGELGAISTGLELETGDRFIITVLADDNSDVEQEYYEVTSIDYDSNESIELELEDLIGDNDLSFDEVEDKDRGEFNLEILGMNSTSVYLNFTSGTDIITFNKVVSDKGAVITLPANEKADTVTLSSTLLTLQEADEEEDLRSGAIVALGVTNSTNDKLYATVANANNVTKEETTGDKYVGYVESVMASKINTDESGDEYSLSIEYSGKEAIADVQVMSGDTVTTTGALGDVLVKDFEVLSVASKNLVIVGGSCINSAAATALNVAEHTCGAAFTTATGVGTGEFLIKGVQDAFSTGALALVVAGYTKDDTTNAATYLTMKDVDTSKEYKGTTATEATLVTA